jgi:flavin reductase (DIM6/NTAB) family NADH-FMN oxidoreductase RutF
VSFKDALAAWPSGVYGLTVSSFASLSLEPPLVLACIASTNRLPAMVRDARRFAISLLGAEQHAASAALAKSGRSPAPSLGVDEEATARGLPVVAGALAHLCCDLHSEMPVGDHVILVGYVVNAAVRPDGEPLVYHRRSYRALV